MGGYIDAEKLEEALQAQAGAVLGFYFPDGKLKAGEYICLNRSRGDKKAGSFRYNPKSRKWSDFATGDAGLGLIGFIRCGLGLGFKEALDRLYCDFGSIDMQVKGVAVAGCGRIADRFNFDFPEDQTSDAVVAVNENIVKIWREAGSVLRTPADAYLRARAIEPLHSNVMRYDVVYNGELKRKVGALILPVWAGNGDLQAIQRIWINKENPANYKAFEGIRKMSLGSIKGGAFKLDNNKDCVVVVEGAEDALAMYQYEGWLNNDWDVWGCGSPPSVWAVLGRSGFLNCVYPDGADVRLYLDRDQFTTAGKDAFKRFLKKLKARMENRMAKGLGDYNISFFEGKQKDYNQMIMEKIENKEIINLASVNL